MNDGLLVVDKPAAMTSHDVVARLRRLLGTRRIGHAGTLDPMATGLLLLGVGRATRLLGHLQLVDKGYDATIRLGVATDTDDAEGTVTARRDASGLDDTAVQTGVRELTGELQQVPSAVSAVKVDGRRAYARVRAGEQVRLTARPVRVHTFEVQSLRRSGAFVDLDVRVECSTGTYVRALARDLGDSLDVGGHLTALRRTRVGPFGLSEAFPLLDTPPPVMPLAAVAVRCFPVRRLDDAQAVATRHGRALSLGLDAIGPVALLAPDGAFLALYEQRGDLARAVAVFAD